MSTDLLVIEVPAIAVLGHDHITEIRTGGQDDKAVETVDWEVVHRADAFCPDCGTKHLTVDFTDEDGSDGIRRFCDLGVWLTVERRFTRSEVAA